MAGGTPPRRRGGQFLPANSRSKSRNTPASAGRTPSRSLQPGSSSEHPRVGGEDGLLAWSIRSGHGTPPRRRGGLAGDVHAGLPRRNTPASAGRTHGSLPSPRLTAEHPRVGGEDLTVFFHNGERAGTPPRRRGGLPLPSLPQHRVRNTPASAGRTLWSTGRKPQSSEHPRVGGEDSRRSASTRAAIGTPPRRRGGPPSRRPGGTTRRNTPASAGRTKGKPRRPGSHTEHPRVGGEDDDRGFGGGALGGTPPRRRGGPVFAEHGLRAIRNTPASAGRTHTPGAVTSPVPEHPRVGGEDAASPVPVAASDGTPPRRRGGLPCCVSGARGVRNTPASAGRTRAASMHPITSSEHPRVGGEDRMRGDLDAALHGTPPRRRGGRQQELRQVQERRNTPASAGRTLRDLQLKEGFARNLPWGLLSYG